MATQVFSEKHIRELYSRLDRQFNIDTSLMPIQLIRKPSRTIACCWVRRCGTKCFPVSFEFNLFYLERHTEADWEDTLLHEYAHAAATIQTGKDCQHGPIWKNICRQLGCRPYPYAYNMDVKEPLMDGGNDGSVPVKCLRCGNVAMQAANSRVVTMLRRGRDAWNSTCPKCGGMRFALVEVEVDAASQRAATR